KLNTLCNTIKSEDVLLSWNVLESQIPQSAVAPYHSATQVEKIQNSNPKSPAKVTSNTLNRRNTEHFFDLNQLKIEQKLSKADLI
ncbi:hypothetical protein BY996DRAFT_6571674, partial [Phakopsora pachyrhizi]